MAEFLEIAKDWFFTLGADYGVNPMIFGAIYVGAIPFFTLSLVWVVKNYRDKKSLVLPSLCTAFFFVSAYLYLIIVGKNVPWWVYGIVTLLIIYGAYSTILKVKSKIQEKIKQ